MRQSILLALYILIVNRKLKTFVIDRTDRSALFMLIIRSLFGTATSISGLVVIKEFGLTPFAIAGNLGPIFTVILSFFVLQDMI